MEYPELYFEHAGIYKRLYPTDTYDTKEPILKPSR